MIYGARAWGDPCPGCGYSWSTTYEEALDLIAGAANRCADHIRGHETAAMAKPDAETWSPSGYIWHLSDWFRIQGQRIYTIANDPLYRWVHLRLDPADLGKTFKYDELPPNASFSPGRADVCQKSWKFPEPPRSKRASSASAASLGILTSLEGIGK
jgi:hypothetical protein